MTVVRRMLGVVVVALATTACGGGGGGAPDGPAVDAFPTAPHTPYPQVPDLGGPRLAHPQLITVTFANDPRAAAFEAYAQWLVGSSWLTTVGADYGVGAGNVAGVAHRPETPLATMTSADIETYLADGITDGSIPRPAAPATLADALYIVYYPSTTSITTTFVNGIMKSSCVDFGGYHGEVHHAGLDFAYSAIPDCGGNLQGLTADETTEMIVSHEVIEAATDAAPISAPAWQLRLHARGRSRRAALVVELRRRRRWRAVRADRSGAPRVRGHRDPGGHATDRSRCQPRLHADRVGDGRGPRLADDDPDPDQHRNVLDADQGRVRYADDQQRPDDHRHRHDPRGRRGRQPRVDLPVLVAQYR